MNYGSKQGASRRARTMRFRVSDEEWTAIEARSASAGLTTSAYLRAAALNHPVKSVYDLDAVADLVKVNGDLGRVAGLLKLWLADWRGHGAKPADVEAMMNDFRALQFRMSALMGKAIK